MNLLRPVLIAVSVSCALLISCREELPGDAVDAMDSAAESYVRLVLAVGEHDPAYVDAYYGPPEWRTEVRAARLSLTEIAESASRLRIAMAGINTSADDEMSTLRHQYVTRQLQALSAYVGILQGALLPFDEESRALYDAVAPVYPRSHFEDAMAQLERLLPGEKPLAQRVEEFRQGFVVPPEKLDTVFVAAIEECRRRTQRHIQLPPDERFVIEYVTDKPWSGYNWYQGKSQSLIQVNTDLDLFVDRAIDLACHEGYPGHHVYNSLLEYHLVDGRGWMEFTVYALFSPQSLIAEGTANFGIDVAFPADERIAFERTVLFPLAGIDPGQAELYYAVLDQLARLNYAGNEAARQYLDGELTREGAVEWLVTYALMSPKRAAQRMDFIDTYRSYVINYNLGQDLVRSYIEGLGGSADDPDRRWEEFARLISSPRLPSGLRGDEQ